MLGTGTCTPEHPIDGFIYKAPECLLSLREAEFRGTADDWLAERGRGALRRRVGAHRRRLRRPARACRPAPEELYPAGSPMAFEMRQCVTCLSSLLSPSLETRFLPARGRRVPRTKTLPPPTACGTACFNFGDPAGSATPTSPTSATYSSPSTASSTPVSPRGARRATTRTRATPRAAASAARRGVAAATRRRRRRRRRRLPRRGPLRPVRRVARPARA